MSVEDYWLAFTRNQDFPRTVCSKETMADGFDKAIRRDAANASQFIDFIKLHNGKEHCYMSVFSKIQNQCKVYDTVFFDIDATSFEKASEKANKVIDSLMSNFSDLHLRIYFSGRKGYHVYADIVPTYLWSYQAAVQSLCRDLRLLNIVDTQVLSDTILCRVPYTTHITTRLMCIPIRRMDVGNAKWILSEAMRSEVKSIAIKPSKKLSEKLSAYVKDMKPFTPVVVDTSDDPVPLCITHAMTKALNGTIEHVERVLLTMYMLNSGASVESIISIFKAAPDYVARRTSYNVHYCEKRSVKIYGCRKIISDGMCPIDADGRRMCSWHPNIYNVLQANKIALEKSIAAK
jgi:hypothetical protein